MSSLNNIKEDACSNAASEISNTISNSMFHKIKNILSENKAKDIIKINLKGKSSIADFMIICSGTSNRHVSALSEKVITEVKSQKGIYGFVLVHSQARSFLDQEWVKHCALSCARLHSVQPVSQPPKTETEH